DRTWHGGSGSANVGAGMLGCSLIIPFKEGKLMLGTWQQIVLIDFDNSPRQRNIIVQLTGE
ncbi:MAG: YjbQ family protein, partial [FCB group bacterium]|nr:YjbQ family protein [FCB group bacterium]